MDEGTVFYVVLLVNAFEHQQGILQKTIGTRPVNCTILKYTTHFFKCRYGLSRAKCSYYEGICVIQVKSI